MTITIKFEIEENEIGVGMKQNITLKNITGAEQILCGRLLRVINEMTDEIETEKDAFMEDVLD